MHLKSVLGVIKEVPLILNEVLMVLGSVGPHLNRPYWSLKRFLWDFYGVLVVVNEVLLVPWGSGCLEENWLFYRRFFHF